MCLMSDIRNTVTDLPCVLREYILNVGFVKSKATFQSSSGLQKFLESP